MTDSVGLKDEIVLVLPAHAEYVSVLRSVCATLAARCDLTVDEIDDLRIAVDEASSLLLPHALPGTPLRAKFDLLSGQLEITASVGASPEAQPDRGGFAWTVLEAVSDAVEVENTGSELSIRVSKKREVGQA